ncbi:MJ1255/VC2487 family glycosyltransferase [Kaarinaea lacus]
MRILYGVQATGNGHITRARTMAKELDNAGISVDYLFSGRNPNKFFNMEPFGDFRCHRGFSFVTEKGKLRLNKTLASSSLYQFVRDVRSLDLSGYDLIITDFEPITAWAARLQKKASIAIGHQYAFLYDIPTIGDNVFTRFILKHFAPANHRLGVHWHHFNSPILPPLIEPPRFIGTYTPKQILVYLPFDDPAEYINWLAKEKEYQFLVYCDVAQASDHDHIHIRPYSRNYFQKDLSECSGVIANAGFGLSSEAIQYGKKLLIKPLKGQMEQLSNAQALLELDLGDVIHNYDQQILKQWLDKPNPNSVRYPNVAASIVQWIQSGRQQDILSLAKNLWQQTDFN